MMYVRVKFRKPTGDAYGGKPYTYRSSLPLKRGDRVLVPTYRGLEHAIVNRVDVVRNNMPEWAYRVGEITAYDRSGAQ